MNLTLRAAHGLLAAALVIMPGAALAKDAISSQANEVINVYGHFKDA